jgi:signal transduction histidine kinase
LRTHAQAAFTATAPGRPGWTVAGDYALAVQPAAGPGSAAVRAVFDLTALNADRRADRLWIAAVDVALAAVGALLAFVLVRRSLAPVGELTRRLLAAGPDAGMPAWTVPQPATTEIGKLQRVLDRHVAAECERQSVLLELGKRDRAEGLAAIAAGLAHEVRNPLAGLLNGVSTLRRFGDDPQVRAETLDLIERGLRSLERVAAATLSTYRPPDDGRGFTEQDLADLTLLVAPEARRRQVALTRDGTLARTLAADANALRQVLMNLLLNAVKASPTAGTVRLKLRDAPGATAFQVVDSGPGLPDEVRAFLRGEQGGRLPQGQGLGLWTVLRLVDALGGRLSAVSLPGGGTTVTVTVVDSGGRSAGAPAAGDDRGAAERSR